jgi:hypothetical protein
VALHVVVGDLVGDALVAQNRDKPIEQRSLILGADRRTNAFGLKRFASISDKRGRASDLANPQDQLRGVVECCAVFCPQVAV